MRKYRFNNYDQRSACELNADTPRIWHIVKSPSGFGFAVRNAITLQIIYRSTNESAEAFCRHANAAQADPPLNGWAE